MNYQSSHQIDDVPARESQVVNSFAEFYRAGQHSTFRQEHRKSQDGDIEAFTADQEAHSLTDAAYEGWILGLPLRASCLTKFDYGNGWRQKRRGRGDALLVPPRTEVRYAISGPTRLLVLTWSNKAWRELDEELLSDPDILSPLFERYFRSTQLEALCKNIWADLARHDDASRLLLSSAHAQMAGMLLRCANSPALRQTSRRADIRKAVAFIHDNLTRDISLGDIAEASGLSVFHFSREFRIQIGHSPIHFVTTKRVELARQLMQNSRSNMAEVARQSGFRTPRRLRDALNRYARGGAES